MKIYIFIIIIFVFILFSCKNSKDSYYTKQNYETISIDIEKSKKTLTSEMFDSIRYIILEDKEKSLIKNVNKIEIDNNNIYIMDSFNKLLCFDKNGNYLNNIGKIGQGPGEYIKIFDFTLDKNLNEILILDRTEKKIIHYNLNGNFKSQSNIKVMASQISILDNNFLLFSGGSDYYTNNKGTLSFNLFLQSLNGDIIKKEFPYKEKYDNIVINKVFDTNYHDLTTLFHYAIYDTIYEITPEYIYPKYHIDFTKNKLPLDKINKENFRSYLNKTQYASIIDVSHSKKYLYINYRQNGRVHFYLKRNNKQDLSVSFLENDLDKTSFSLSKSDKIIDNKVFYVKYPEDILRSYQSDSVSLKTPNGIKTITKDSNPVIVIGYLK